MILCLMSWDLPTIISGPQVLTIQHLSKNCLLDLRNSEIINYIDYINGTSEGSDIGTIVYQSKYLLIDEMNEYHYPMYRLL